jgi:hypothetical protein
MRPHHEETIRKLVDHFSKDEGYLGLIVGGSIAKGVETEYADIDVMLVVTDESYERHRKEHRLSYGLMEFCDYPGGYVDVKVVDIPYLRAAAERGNEPTRAAFDGALVAYSAAPEIDDLVNRIPVYQEKEQQDKIHAFAAQFECAYFYVGEAVKRNDRYLLNQAISSLILYGGRLILAHNRILYPYHKLFMMELDKAVDKPENLMELIRALLEQPSGENAKAFYDAMKAFRLWNDLHEPWFVRFLRDTELAWMEGKAYVGDI